MSPSAHKMTNKNKQNRSPQVLPPVDRLMRSKVPPTIELSDLSEEGRAIVKLLLAKLEEQEALFTEKLEEKERTMQDIRKENAVLKEKMASLEEQIDDLAVNSRGNDVILSGDRLPASTIGENCPAVITDAIKQDLNYSLDVNQIVSAYRVGKKPSPQGPDKRKILVKLSCRESRNDLIQAAKRVKPSGLFVNESLTPQRSRILYCIRQAKRQYPARVSGHCGKYGRNLKHSWRTNRSQK